MESFLLLFSLILIKGEVFLVKTIIAITMPIKPSGIKTETKTIPTFDNPLLVFLTL